MQVHPAARDKKSLRSHLTRSSRPGGGWTYSTLTALLFGLIVLIALGGLALYLTWDYMPARVQYLPRYVQSHFAPARPHTAFVPTPVVEVAPEEALASLQQSQARSEPAVESVAEPVATALPAAEGESASEPVAEAPASEPEVSAPVEAAPPAAALFAPPAPAIQLTGIRHEYQGWNNCGPATLGMQLSFFGRSETQAQTAPVLKPDKDDKNVSPDEMAAYARSLGFEARVLVGMDLTELRTLLTNGFPVIVESWYIPDPDDEMGHYLLATGYDENTLTFYDSYNGPDVTEPAAEFDELWKVFNRTAIVIWPPEREAEATAILGDLLDQQAMFERARATAYEELQANPQDRFAWFNLGTNLIALGDVEGAVKAFDTARSLNLPWRMLWYQFGAYQAYFQNGEYEEVIGLATTTLESAGNLEESFYWRGRARAALGQSEQARQDFQQALRYNPTFSAASEALATLP